MAKPDGDLAGVDAQQDQQPSPAMSHGMSPAPMARRTRGRSSTSDTIDGEQSNDGSDDVNGRRDRKPTKKRKLGKDSKAAKRKQPRDQDDDDLDDDESVADLCEVCHINENDDLSLICDACDKVFHTYCLNPPLEQIPPGEWVCPQCVLTIDPEAPQKSHVNSGLATEAASTYSPSPSLHRASSAEIPAFPAALLRDSPQRLTEPSPVLRPLAPAPAALALRPIRPQQSPPRHDQPLPAAPSSSNGFLPSSFHHSGDLHQPSRHSPPPFDAVGDLQEQNHQLQRENQKLLDYIDRQTRRIEELEEALRAMQYKNRKLEGQLVDAQAQLAHSAYHHGPTYVSQGYLPRPDDADYRASTLYPLRVTNNGSSHHPLRRVSDFPHQSYRDDDYAVRSSAADDSSARSHHHHLQPHQLHAKSSRTHDDPSYYRDAKPSLLSNGSFPSTAAMPYPPSASASSVPYSQPPVYQKSSVSKHLSNHHHHMSYPPTSHHSTYHASAPRRGSDGYKAHTQLPPPPIYFRHHEATNAAATDSFLPRPPLPDLKAEQEPPPPLSKVAIPVYSSDEEDEPTRDARRRPQDDHDDDAANVLSSMKRTEASSERLNMSTPTATDAANAAASTLAILKPTDDEVEEEGVASGGHRIGLYTPRSRRLMLDRYLLKRSKVIVFNS
ncbi:hypothetical protein, variant 2 [Aphanomyces astaci]|uniref:PHD-type domain-containing protein n=1 Tax=Aphanomyces astaci TaxID=112090 RepID=W4GKB0_APHAT|nr:hypothetical protein, variant 3 [Aphanomyces astaci]XP_009831200.1 hypothetical protein, variant 2 [Aphanomyces astaci]ETV79358.1 hypothetical protein, variant 2 [Aphanomyces astaci]ETV79359.1 hypothetical protein, variant 3 [Aphanomyces astaci]|eukprot:XP_009831198.1 hypothetical protein, variant 3 [Aphanomyces astaci]